LEGDLVGLIFNTIGVSDGMSTVLKECVFFSFRDVIADSIETVVGAGMMV
jgi:dihydroxy-acid dehydratase